MPIQSTAPDLPMTRSNNWKACLNEPERLLQSLEAEKGRRNLYDFVRLAWHVLGRLRPSSMDYISKPSACICRPSRRDA